jgi:hypothetical protein
MVGLFGLCLLIIMIAKAFLGTDSKAYTWIFCFAFVGLAISIGGMTAHVIGLK